MKKPTIVSVIIPVLNEEKHIHNCLESIEMQELPQGTSVEIIVIDNGSTDATVMKAREHKAVKLFVLRNATIAALRNYGVRQASGDIYAFLDADCIAGKQWLRHALNDLDRNDMKIGAVGSHYSVRDDVSWIARVWAYNHATRTQISEVAYIPSGNMIIPREVFEEIEGFNENLSTSEDTELCLRLKKAGFSILSDKSIIVFHDGAATRIGEFFKKQLWHGANIPRIFIMTKGNRRYGRVVLYSIIFALLIMFMALGVLMINPTLIITALLCALIISFLAMLKVCIRKRSLAHSAQLWVVYFIYGVARGLRMLDLRIWKPIP